MENIMNFLDEYGQLIYFGALAIFLVLLILLVIIVVITSTKRNSSNNAKPKKVKKAKKKDLQKDYIERIKAMSPAQFDAYYKTLISVYKKECFHESIAKEYSKLLEQEIGKN